jgi:hypothetical protein
MRQQTNGKSGFKLDFCSAENQICFANADKGAFQALNSARRHFLSGILGGVVEAMTPLMASVH